jgi:hypothetical protein
MTTNRGRRSKGAIILLVVLAGCSAGAGGPQSSFRNADFRTAQQYMDFTTAQQYRKDALNAQQRGDSEDALLYMQKAQTLETRVNQVSATPPRTALQLEHRAIAPAGGSMTCNNTGINRFFCF